MPDEGQCRRVDLPVPALGGCQDMTTTFATSLVRRPAWKALKDPARQMRSVHLRTLFAEDPARGTRLTAEDAGLFLDYSKNRVTDQSLMLLVQLAKESGLRERID